MANVRINVYKRFTFSIYPSLKYLTSEISSPQYRSESMLNIKMGKIYIVTLT